MARRAAIRSALPPRRRAVTARVVVGLLVMLAWILSGCAIMGAPAREPVTLRLAYSGDPAFIERQAREFHETNPLITVEIIELRPWDWGHLNSLIAAGEVDIFRSLNLPVGDDALLYVTAEKVLPLDGLLGHAWDAIRDDYVPGAWQALSVEGRQYGVPVALDPVVVYAFASALEALALPLPDANWSLEEFAAMAEQLHLPEGLPGTEVARMNGLCSDPTTDLGPVVFTLLHGGRIVEPLQDPIAPALDDPLTAEAINWYARLFYERNVGAKPSIQQVYAGMVPSAAAVGGCGLWLGSFGDRGGERTAWPWQIDWHMLPLPVDDAPTGVARVDGYYVTTDCAAPNEALELIRFLSDHWQPAGARIPARRSLAADAAYLNTLSPQEGAIVRAHMDEAGSLWGRTILLPLSSGVYGCPYAEVRQELHTAVQTIIGNRLDAADVLADAQLRAWRAFEQD